MRSFVALLSLLLCAARAPAQWTLQESGTAASLRGVSAVSRDVAWASGTLGTCLRTVDGGTRWTLLKIPGAADLDFRDVHATDAQNAYLLACGAGEKSRIYKTHDGGQIWDLQFHNRDARGFLDALAFWDAEHGLVLGDPIEGRFLLLKTDDGGRNWTRLDAQSLPPALEGEGAFAASGTCLVVQGSSNVWFATGGARVARVFHSTDRGRTWTAHETPLRAGAASAGIFSLAFSSADQGVAVGGDFQRPEVAAGNVARSSDGGRTWHAIAGPRPAGYRSAVAFLPRQKNTILIATGPTGSDRSADGGEHWEPLSALGFHAISVSMNGDACWAVGDKGRIARLRP